MRALPNKAIIWISTYAIGRQLTRSAPTRPLHAKPSTSLTGSSLLIDAHTIVAALGLVPAIKNVLKTEAEKLANGWLTKHKNAIKGLTDERQEAYRQIREMSVHPLDVDLARPNTWMQPTTAREANSTERDLPRFKTHTRREN